MTDQPAPQAPTWDETVPHFSTTEKGDRITTAPLEGPGMLGFIAMATLVLWAPASAGVALFFNGASDGDVVGWHYMMVLLYAFLPCILTGITADEARDRFGQKSTGIKVALIPAFAGTATGLLAAAIWVGGAAGAYIAVGSVVCSLGAVVATILAGIGIRYTRKRQARMTSLRRNGHRSPGVLREVRFLKKWSGGNPRFKVIAEFTGESGLQLVHANMITTTRRVPRTGAAVVVSWFPADPDVHIELDYTKDPRFDPKSALYTQPSGN